MEDYIITGRRFLQNSATVCSTFLIPQLAALGGREPVANENPWRMRTHGEREPVADENRIVRFGLMTDVHPG
ncbi:MAG: hypothetical protein WCP07_09115 [bacterium]